MPTRSATRAFTLVELLVVIGIVCLLLGIILAALLAARKAAQQVQCGSQLRQIGNAVRLYANANRGFIHMAKDQSTWLTIWAPAGLPSALRLIDPNNTKAYWGVAYFPYLAPRAVTEASGDDARQIVDAAYGLWHCPASVSVDPSFGAQPDDPVSYGVNARITQGRTVTRLAPPAPPTFVVYWSKLDAFRRPSEVIFCQDAVEQRMEGDSSDTLSAYGGSSNLVDWRPNGALNIRKLDAVYEYYRHGRRSQVLWLDGHVDPIRQSLGANVPQGWYTGQ